MSHYSIKYHDYDTLTMYQQCFNQDVFYFTINMFQTISVYKYEQRSFKLIKILSNVVFIVGFYEERFGDIRQMLIAYIATFTCETICTGKK